MERKSYLTKIISFVVVIALLLSVAVFFGAKFDYSVKAESTTYTVTFYAEHYGFENTTITVNAGDSLTESDIPAEPENDGIYEFVWPYKLSDLQNINQNISITLIRRVNPSLIHTVTFIFADGTTKSVQVVHGGSVIDPPTTDGLRFGEKNTYSASLDNITSDLEVVVGVSSTMKYVVIALCGATLVAGLATIVILLVKMMNKNNEIDDNPELVEATNVIETTEVQTTESENNVEVVTNETTNE